MEDNYHKHNTMEDFLSSETYFDALTSLFLQDGNVVSYGKRNNIRLINNGVTDKIFFWILRDGFIGSFCQGIVFLAKKIEDKLINMVEMEPFYKLLDVEIFKFLHLAVFVCNLGIFIFLNFEILIFEFWNFLNFSIFVF